MAASPDQTPNADARLAQALRERDDALAELATARAESEALRRLLASLGETEIPNYPRGTAPGKPPFRYVMVDAANARVKAALGSLHEPAKAAAERVADLFKRG